jgi:ATP-dependent Lon protease
MNNCTYVFRSGKRKNQTCGKEIDSNKTFCSRHTPDIASDAPQFLETVDILQYKLLGLDISQENKAVILKRFRYIETLSTTSTEYHKNLNWLRHALNFPYTKMTKVPISVSNTNTEKVTKEVSDYVKSVYTKLDSYIYGMKDVKEEIMSFVCKRISNPDSNDHVMALHGKNGTGKSRLAHGLARALDLPIKTVNLGSVNDVAYFTGHGFTYVDSEPGRIVQIMNETQCKNCIIYFDELDKIHQTDKGQAIYAFLTHLIDPTQNTKFQDVYLSGLELDMSKVFFVFSFNDETLIDSTVKDRLKVIKIEDPTDADKVAIAEKFIIPEICKNVNFQTEIERRVIEQIVQRDKSKSGLRGVKRMLEEIIGKLNVARMLDEETQGTLSYYDACRENMIDRIMNRQIERSNEAMTYESIYL